MEIITLTPDQLKKYIREAVSEALAAAVAPKVASIDAVLTVKETAKRLKRSEKFIRDEIQRGRLSADNANHKIADTRASWRIRESDIATYMKRLR